MPRVTVDTGGGLQGTEKCHHLIINKKQMRKIACMFVRRCRK